MTTHESRERPVVRVSPEAIHRPSHAAGRPEPCAIVIFGASGDLAHRKLVPALYNLLSDGLLPERVAIVGVAREGSRDEIVASLKTSTSEHSRKPLDARLWDRFAESLCFTSGDFQDERTYAELEEQLALVERERSTGGNRIFYLATPPDLFAPIVKHLRQTGLVHAPGGVPWSRVIIEKPFGRDLDSARALNDAVAAALDERQIYRIDHYLGKETVQNILVFRFGNSIFEPLWNRRFIDHVQITAAESIGVEGRGKFYDAAGVLRDVVQNHALQVLALCAMEAPVSFVADDIRDRKIEVWRSLRPLAGSDLGRETVRAQYRGYRDEEGVARESHTPTFAALRLFIDNWRWQGVPFYLRAGKKLGARLTEVAIHFQPIPLCLFDRAEACKMAPNVIVLRIQPDEGITLRFAAKVPGEGVTVANILMQMDYREAFGTPVAEAYERLLFDCIRGDATLFARRDGVETAWRFITPILEAWDAADAGTSLPVYEPGTAGPEAADALLARDGREWRPLGDSK
jgi:glucose-6-phosphate 1-dehydrogenase